jgi:t-SNARE complex subunit (syntaxin)
MADSDQIKQLLIEIRDNQREALVRQAEHLDVARRHFEHAQQQIKESVGLQREAVARARTATRVALPGIALCIAAIIYLVVKYL